MTTWLYLTIFSYFLLSFVALFDKYLLKKSFPKPSVLAFYVGILGTAAVFLIPFGFQWQFPDLWQTVITVGTGFLFVFALIPWYYFLQKEEASRVSPLVGGLVPVFALLLAWLILNEHLSRNEMAAFLPILAGSLLITLQEKQGKITVSRNLLFGILAALLFSAANVLAKLSYQKLGFLTGFVWIRSGGLLAALVLLSTAPVRKTIFQNPKKPASPSENNENKNEKPGKRKWLILLSGQTIGAISALCLQYSFYLGPISLINALQGIQYVFLFFNILIVSLYLPQIIKEKMTFQTIVQKIISIGLIAWGLGILALAP